MHCLIALLKSLAPEVKPPAPSGNRSGNDQPGTTSLSWMEPSGFIPVFNATVCPTSAGTEMPEPCDPPLGGSYQSTGPGNSTPVLSSHRLNCPVGSLFSCHRPMTPKGRMQFVAFPLATRAVAVARTPWVVMFSTLPKN